MKYFFLASSFLFLVFAFIQLNDPDPILWFAVYLLITISCFMAYRGKYYPPLAALIAIIYIGWAIYLFPTSLQDWMLMEEESKSFKMKMPGIEESRESMGLILGGIMMVIIFFKGIKLRQKIT